MRPEILDYLGRQRRFDRSCHAKEPLLIDKTKPVINLPIDLHPEASRFSIDLMSWRA